MIFSRPWVSILNFRCAYKHHSDTWTRMGHGMAAMHVNGTKRKSPFSPVVRGIRRTKRKNKLKFFLIDVHNGQGCTKTYPTMDYIQSRYISSATGMIQTHDPTTTWVNSLIELTNTSNKVIFEHSFITDVIRWKSQVEWHHPFQLTFHHSKRHPKKNAKGFAANTSIFLIIHFI